MRIAAFDLGSTWAVAWNWMQDNSPYAASSYDLNPDRKKPKLNRKRPEVLGLFADHLQGRRRWLGHAEVIVYERPFARGQAATRLLWGAAGILEAEAHLAGVPILDMTPGEIKKWATGNGQADKDMMLAAAWRLGYGGTNEHEADAFCLLKFAEATLAKEPA